jgi:hypothetical protein
VIAISCDVSKGSIEILANFLTQCNGSKSAAEADSLTAFGRSTSARSVSIRNSAVSVVLSRVSVTATAPFTVEESSVVVVLEGSNSLDATAANSAGVECAAANLTIKGSGGGALSAEGGSSGSGVGLGGGGVCASHVQGLALDM